MDVLTAPCSEMIGAIRHHAHFTESEEARVRIGGFVRTIRELGVQGFVDREYPVGSGKAFIVNEAAGRLCVVDGNAHLVALAMHDPAITLAKLVEATGRPEVVRLWREGWEAGSGQDRPFDVYIPFEADASRIPACREGLDGFKNPPLRMKIIPADIAFDSPLFSVADRGRPIGETVRALQELHG